MAGNSNINNDPFEEFEFRPINEGLGFHRKQKSAQSTIASGFTSGPTPTRSTGTGATSTPQFNANTPIETATRNTSFSAPLPRNEFRAETRTDSTAKFQVPTIEDDSIAKAQTAVNEILKNLNQKRNMDFANDTEKVRHEMKKSKPYFFAAILDGMLILAAFLLSMILMLSVTKVDLFMNLSHPETSQFVYLATLGLFLSVTFIYMVVNRAFLGYTPGEWAFDQRCGEESQMDSLMYIPRLALRTAIVIFTGFITLPVLSYLFNKDMAGQIAGVNLFKRPHA
ncbi:RDD family protein [bacterium]|nr:RDD family protein [bacterium]